MIRKYLKNFVNVNKTTINEFLTFLFLKNNLRIDVEFFIS